MATITLPNGGVLQDDPNYPPVASGGGGGGGGGTTILLQDPDTGYPERPGTPVPQIWMGWSNPSGKESYDIFIPIPQPT